MGWSRIKEDFDLNGISEVYFWKSEWEKFDPQDHYASVSASYLTYRFAYMAYFFVTTTENFLCADEEYPSFYFIFLTNQAYTLQLIYSTVFFLYVLWVFCRHKRNENVWNYDDNRVNFHHHEYKLPFVCKIIWILINAVQVVPYVVSIIYWVFLFDERKYPTLCAVIDNVLVHAFNSQMALLDSLIIAVPIRLSHVIFPFLFALCYVLFSGVYELFGGAYPNEIGYIYSILDWKQHPGVAALTSLGGIVSAFVLHFFMSWGVYRLRVFMKTKFQKKRSDSEREWLLLKS